MRRNNIVLLKYTRWCVWVWSKLPEDVLVKLLWMILPMLANMNAPDFTRLWDGIISASGEAIMNHFVSKLDSSMLSTFLLNAQVPNVTVCPWCALDCWNWKHSNHMLILIHSYWITIRYYPLSLVSCYVACVCIKALSVVLLLMDAKLQVYPWWLIWPLTPSMQGALQVCGPCQHAMLHAIKYTGIFGVAIT